jgi:plasmid stabilization system protein ParE
MTIEWSADALADLDRFASFLHERHARLAKIVAAEIVAKAQLLSNHPKLGRPSRDAKNIGRSCCRFSTRLMSSNIAMTASGSSCYASFTAVKRGNNMQA